MIIYNVTTRVDRQIATQWLEWTREQYIPAMIATGYFTNAVILRLLDLEDGDDPTYAVQYYTESEELYRAYLDEISAEMREVALNTWGDKIISFRSVLEVV